MLTISDYENKKQNKKDLLPTYKIKFVHVPVLAHTLRIFKHIKYLWYNYLSDVKKSCFLWYSKIYLPKGYCLTPLKRAN